MEPTADPSSASPATESTAGLIDRMRQGDEQAGNLLFERYSRRMRRWASGRLPAWARQGIDTQDLVQDTLMQVFRHIGRFEHRREGAFQAYVRQAMLNRIRNLVRGRGRRPAPEPLHDQMLSGEMSPLEAAVGRERLTRYERALSTLRPIDREAIIARVEMGSSYAELATLLDLPSADAARKTTERAVVKLAAVLAEDPPAEDR